MLISGTSIRSDEGNLISFLWPTLAAQVKHALLKIILLMLHVKRHLAHKENIFTQAAVLIKSLLSDM